MSDNFFKISKGLTLAGQASVSNAQNGDIYYDSTKNTYVFRNNGFNVDLARRVDVASATSLTSADLTSAVVTASLVRITGSTLASVHGITASVDAKTLVLYNQTSQPLIVKNASATEGTAANRIVTYNGSDMTLLAGQAVMLGYDSSQSRWVVLSTPGSSSSSTSVNYISNGTAETDTTGWSTTTNNETITVTIASPAVFSFTIPPIANPLRVGQALTFNTTGALPTGLTAGTTYYVTALPSTGSFKVSATLGGAEVNTSGTQSGTHTMRAQNPSNTIGSNSLSPNITLTRTTSSPLRGNGSFLITKDANNRQGEGVYYPFTIDLADTTKVLQLSFDYTIGSGTYSGGTPTTDSDIVAYIEDVTNGSLIQLAPYKLDGSVVGTQLTFRATFQASTSTSYRIRFHVATTSASAYTIKYDNLIVGPQISSYASAISDSINVGASTIGAVTTAPTKGTIVTDAVSWYRSGEFAFITYSFNQSSGGTTGTGEYLFSIPSSIGTIDSSKATFNTSTGISAALISLLMPATGKGRITSGGDYDIFGGVAYDASHFRVLLAIDYTTGSAVMGSGAFNLSVALAFSFTIKVPIAGWASTLSVSDQSDGRVVVAKYLNTGAVSSSTTVPLNFSTLLIDTHSAVTTGAAWKFTAPLPGYYKVSIWVSSNGTTDYRVYKNGVDTTEVIAFAISGGSLGVGTTVIQLNAGDFFDIRTAAGATSSAGYNKIAIERVSGNSVPFAQEKVVVEYTAANQSYNNTTILNYQSKVIDTHGAVTTGANWVFTCPIAGYYQVTFSARNNANSGGDTPVLYKNGSILKNVDSLNGDGSTFQGGQGSCLILLNAGDTLNVKLSGASTRTTTNNATDSHISIHKI